MVNSKDGTNKTHNLGKGKYESADFKGSMTIHTCRIKINGHWEKVRCYDVFDRKRNNKSGGGCGCKYFNCL